VHPRVDPGNGALDKLVKWNDKGAGVFFTVNATDGNGRQAHNIVGVRAVFVDLDGAPLAPVLECGLDPHDVVESSPRRYHAYWLVDDCPLDQFELVQRALAQRFGGDPSVHDLPRVMRLPGFIHRKGDPFVTRMLEGVGHSGSPYTLAEIVGTLQLDLARTRPSPPEASGADGKVPPGNRHAHLFAVGRSMAKKCLSRDAVLAALYAENQARCDPPLADEDVGYLAERAFTAKDSLAWQESHSERISGAQGVAAIVGVGEGQPGAENRVAADCGGPPWPEAMDAAAMHGIAGEFVRMIEPNTESDSAAILMQFLVSFGALVGRGPHYRVEGDEHHANLYAILVGKTAKGRKGTSWSRVRQVFERIPGWKPHVSGLSSGEGLKYSVRDAREATKRNKSGELVTEVVDEGITDKRLLVVESEFATALRNAQRQGNTLSAAVREGWDSGNLRTLTKNDPVEASGAHICIVGHITDDELRAELTATDTANGFANRFLFVAVRRSKCLPFGGDREDEAAIEALAVRLAACADQARRLNRVGMTAEARHAWARVYPELSEGNDGLHGAVTARAEAQVIRLALLYCLLDGADAIGSPHIMAALAIWQYCDATAKHVFGASLGDRVADEIMRRLSMAGDTGLTRTEIRDLFGRHKSTEQIGQALDVLRRHGRARCEDVRTDGRSAEVWRAVK
jgi:hypothetical protein